MKHFLYGFYLMLIVLAGVFSCMVIIAISQVKIPELNFYSFFGMLAAALVVLVLIVLISKGLECSLQSIFTT